MAFIKPNNRLYHYRSFDTAIKHILPEHKLRLGLLVKTNDPRENKSFIFSTKFKTDIDIGPLNERNKEISDILRSDCKVLSFSNDSADYFGYESSRMWAYYGSNHQGVCLEFDKSEFINENSSLIKKELLRDIKYYQFSIKTGIIHKVIDYNEINLIGKEKYLKEKFRLLNLDYLYFTKNKEWESEAEIRLIHFSNNITDEFCSIKNSLKNIYLGLDFDEKNLQPLIDLCPNVDIYKLEFNEVRMAPKQLYNGCNK